MKTFVLSIFCLLTSSGIFASANIEGFWQAMDDKTGKPGCVVAVYEYKDKWYGRIIGIFDEAKPGTYFGTLANPKKRAPGIKGHPNYSGLDLIWNLEKHGSKYIGSIVDPRKGDIYNAEVWREGKNLIVRGKLWIFGRNQTWHSINIKDLPKDFKIAEVSKFVPVIPVPNK